MTRILTVKFESTTTITVYSNRAKITPRFRDKVLLIWSTRKLLEITLRIFCMLMSWIALELSNRRMRLTTVKKLPTLVKFAKSQNLPTKLQTTLASKSLHLNYRYQRRGKFLKASFSLLGFHKSTPSAPTFPRGKVLENPFTARRQDT